MKRVEVIAPEELDAPLLARWRALQAGDATLDSPFLAPDFAQAVARARPGVRIALVRDGSEPAAAFFPFQVDGRDGVPIGYPFADRGGLIAPPGLALPGDELARGCGVRRLHFRGVPAGQETFQPYLDALHSSPLVEIARARPRPREARRYRKLERDLGPLRFEPALRSPAALGTLIAWKRERAARSGTPDPLQPVWIERLLALLIESDPGPGFQAPLSALFAGERMIAAQVGLRSATTWHWWLPAYDASLSAYSPGLVFLLEMLAHAARAGVTTLDFGTGPEPFKRRFATALLPVVRGCVVPDAADRRRWQLRRALRGALLGSQLEQLARRLSGRPATLPTQG